MPGHVMDPRPEVDQIVGRAGRNVDLWWVGEDTEWRVHIVIHNQTNLPRSVDGEAHRAPIRGDTCSEESVHSSMQLRSDQNICKITVKYVMFRILRYSHLFLGVLRVRYWW